MKERVPVTHLAGQESFVVVGGQPRHLVQQLGVTQSPHIARALENV